MNFPHINIIIEMLEIYRKIRFYHIICMSCMLYFILVSFAYHILHKMSF